MINRRINYYQNLSQGLVREKIKGEGIALSFSHVYFRSNAKIFTHKKVTGTPRAAAIR